MERKKKSTQTRISTAFLLTLNQVDKFVELKNYLKTLHSFQYAIAGKEKAPTTGHIHIHIFIQFSKPIRLSIKKLNGCHVDKCFGSTEQNVVYVKKGGDIIWEEGELRNKGFLTIAQIKNMSEKEREGLPAIYYNIAEKLLAKDSCNLRPSDSFKTVKVYYISGRSGIGKTRYAHYLIGNETYNVVKFVNGFWMGFSNQSRIALYDDWRDTHMDASEFLHFIDYNKQVMNVKGGFMLNNYTVIIITSILRLKDIYQDASLEDREQWTRRVEEIFLSVVYNDERAKLIRVLINSIINYLKLHIYKLIKTYIK